MTPADRRRVERFCDFLDILLTSRTPIERTALIRAGLPIRRDGSAIVERPHG